MGARGRQASTSLSVVSRVEIDAVRRPAPPADFSDEMAEEWWKIVNRLPVDWFPAETLPLLTQYCTHIIRARTLREAVARIENSQPFELDSFITLTNLEEKHTRSIASLATRMRISQQATHDAQKRKGPRTSSSKTLWAGADDNSVD